MLTLTLCTLMVAAPVPKEATPPGPPPRLVELKADADGKIRVQAVREVSRTVNRTTVTVENGKQVVKTTPTEVKSMMMTRVELSDIKDLGIWTADGKEADKAVAMKKLLEGGLVVVSNDGKKVDPKYLKLFRDDVLVLASPELLERPVAGIATPLPANAVGNVIINRAVLPAQVQVAPLMPVKPAIAVPAADAAAPVKKPEAKAEDVKAEVKPVQKVEEKKKD